MLITPRRSYSTYFAPFELFLDSGSGKCYVAGQLYLLWESFQKPRSLHRSLGQYCWYRLLQKLPSVTSPKYSSYKLILKDLGLCLVPGQGPRKICGSTLRQACSYQCCEAAAMEMSASLPENPNFRCHCRISVSLGPSCLSAKHLGTEPLVVLVSLEVLGILQHVTSLLTLAFKSSYEFCNTCLQKRAFWTFFLSFYRLMKTLSWDSTRYFY